MELELQKNSINESVILTSVAAQQNLDTQISLPDYCGDIKRILKCTVEPGVSSVSLKGEKLSASGAVTIRLIYIGEDDRIDCYETESDLSVSSEIKNPPENALVLAKAKTDYINCRAMSQRRVSVSGNIAVNFIVYGEKKKEVISECRNMGMQTKKMPLKAQSLVCQGEKSFDLGETLSIDSDKPDIGKIICSTGYCVIDSQKAVSGKLLIKGELCCDIVYCVDKEDTRLCKITHTMPVNQIIDLAGIDDKSICSVKAKICRLIVNVKADSSGKNRLIEFAARVSAFVRCSVTKEFEVVDDCYSTDYEIKSKFENKNFLCPVMKISDEKQAKKTVEFQKGIKDILHIWPSETMSKIRVEKNKAVILCSSLVSLLYTDEKGTPSYAEKSLDYEYEEKLQENCDNFYGEADCFVKNIFCEVKGKESAEITADFKVDGEICSVTNKKLCTGVEIDENSRRKGQRPALTVCFSQKGERIWDIARKYNTTQSAICEENGIASEVLSEAKMLMIPSV